MKRGQLSLTAFIVSFLVLVLAVVLYPVIKVVITYVVGNSGMEGTVNGYALYLFPALLIVAAIVGFFVWNSAVTN